MTSSIALDSRQSTLHIFSHEGGDSLDLRLPLTREGWIYRIATIAGGIPSSRALYPEATRALEPQFLSTGDLDMLVLDIRLEPVEPILLASQFLVFVSRQKLMRIIEGKRNASTFQAVEWEDWGPAITRWIRDLPGTREWTVYSSRYVCCTHYTNLFDEDPQKTHQKAYNPHMLVLDFNPYSIRRGAKPFDTEKVKSRVVTSSDTIFPEAFAKPVICKLPFRAIITPHPAIRFKVIFDNQNGNLVFYKVRSQSREQHF